jgi:putative intracellular protease/amidase
MTEQTATQTAQHTADPTEPHTSRRVLVGRFVRHYLEMVLAMVAGMMLLGMLVGALAGAAGLDYSHTRYPVVGAVEMALTMSAGMAFWMRYRRHHWRHVAEMTAAMVVPLVVLLPLVWAGVMAASSLMMVEHVVMFPLMLAVMLRAPRAYTGPVQGRLDGHPRARTALRGTAALAVAIAVPITVGAIALPARTLAAYDPAERTAPVAATSPVLPAHDPAKPTAVVVVGDRGAEIGDVLGPYEVLVAAGRFNVYTVAPQRRPVPLTGGLDLVPQLTFTQLTERLGGEAPDVVVTPMMPDAEEPSNEPVTTWLKAQHADGALLVGICAGAKVLASAGLLDGHAATTHWARINGFEDSYPDVEWQRGVRWVDDGEVVTTAGILSGIEGTLHVVERLVGADVATSAATAVGWQQWAPGPAGTLPVRSVGPRQSIALLNAGFRWDRPAIGVLLTDGVGELELASAFDPYGGHSFAATTLALGTDDGAIVSEHGLEFVPRAGLRDAGDDVDRLIVPGAGAAQRRDPAIAAEARTAGLTPDYVHATAGFPFDATLADLARTADAPTARYTSRILEYGEGDLELDGPGVPVDLLLRPVALGLVTLGLLLLLSTLGRRLRHRP